jgi:fumarate hydratase class II
MTEFRIEKDSLGDVKVPREAYWGAQTQRAIGNFPVSRIVFPPAFIRSLALIKRACAEVNRDLRLLDRRSATAIIRACDEILDGRFNDQFPLDIFQTGSGTSTNMNANEVIATRANEILTGTKHSNSPVHPNDHVNMGQSSNDVMPTAIHVSALVETHGELLPALKTLRKTISDKQRAMRAVVKTGRTHLMDATPMTLEQEMSGWAAQVDHAMARILSTFPRLSELAIGGTAVGTGINTPAGFGRRVAKRIAANTKLDFREASNHFEAQAAQDAVVELSGQLRAFATSLMKIANDLRLMNSGPMAGFAEIRLPSLQPGSSIMPGKVNPVIPEAARMVSAQVIGNDAVVALANAMGDFQLNVMLPVMAHNILQSIGILAAVSRLLAEKAIAGFEVNEARLQESLHRNPIIATVLVPMIGYDKSAEVVKKARRENTTVRQAVVALGYLSAKDAERILDPMKMTGPGKKGRGT